MSIPFTGEKRGYALSNEAYNLVLQAPQATANNDLTVKTGYVKVIPAAP